MGALCSLRFDLHKAKARERLWIMDLVLLDAIHQNNHVPQQRYQAPTHALSIVTDAS